MSITTVGSSLIHYEAVGRGSPVVFVHGWFGTWRYWWSSMQALSTMRRTFALDLWGFGDSSKQQDKYDFRSYVDMLEMFIGQLGIALPVTLVGHALGAAVALRYAAENPDDVSGLVAVSLPVNGMLLNARLHAQEPDAFIDGVRDRLRTHPEIETEMRKNDPSAVRALAKEMSLMDLASDLEWVTCKTLLLFGDQDGIVRPPNGEVQHLLRPGSRYRAVTLEGLSHFPMLEEAALFNRLLLDFINSSEDQLHLITPKELWQRRTR